MKKFFQQIISLFGIIFIASTISCMTNSQMNPSNDQTQVVEGKITIRGNEPHSYVHLETQSKQHYCIVGEFEQAIRESKQHQTVKLKGRVVKKAKGPGFPAEFEVLEIIE